jgi:hypothetical protein
MRFSTQRVLRISGFVLLGLAVLAGIAVAVAYPKREALLQAALERTIRKADRSYGLRVSLPEARFVGPTTVALANVVVVPADRDTLIRLRRVEVRVNPWPLLLGKIRLTRLLVHDGLLHVVRRDSTSNLDFLLRRKTDSTETRRRVNLADVAENLTDNLLGYVPDDLDVRNLELRLTDDDQRVSLRTETALMDDEQLTSTLRLNGSEATWHLNGHLDGGDEEADLALFADGKPLQLNYLEQKFGMFAQTDTLRLQLRGVDRSGGELRIDGTTGTRNLRFFHPAIAADTVLVPQSALDAVVAVGENYVGLDSSSVIRLGRASARPFVRYTLSPVKLYDLALHTDNLPAQDVFDAFPKGLFETLEGIRVTGQLRYDFRLHLDSSQPDSVQLEAGLTPTNFRILQLGRVDFRRINQPFDYTPYEGGKPVRTIRVGPENPDFTPLNAISKNLRNAVLTAEDFSFFQHKGFNEKAFRVSLATNFKAKSFKRGGSTISMQLVKNAFLNRHKDLARKVEEILIVWLIENERLVPKERMYEVYLNLIEWGRNVYGIGEAARYYFGTAPENLTLGESLFLAYVIPSPKRALTHFNPDGSLHVGLRGWFRFVGRIMTRRGLAAADTNAYGFYGVRLRESLRRQLFPYADTTRAGGDSTFVMPMPDIQQIQEEEEERESGGGGLNRFFRRLFGGKDKEEKGEVQPETPVYNPGDAEGPAVEKTRKERRQERREQRRREREERKRLEEEGKVRE